MNNAPTQARDGDEETVETPAPGPSETPEAAHGDARPSLLGRWASQLTDLPSRVSDLRRRRVASAETRAEQQRLRDETERAEERERLVALSQTAAAKRKRGAVVAEVETDAELSHIPRQMRVAGVWSDRSVASIVFLAPLAVSGYYTVKTGMDTPLNMDQGVALAFTGGLEGSVWYLLQLRGRFRLEGYSTFSLTMAIAGIITLIASMLLGHAIWQALGSSPISVDLPFSEASLPLSDLVPAVAISLMSAIGTFVASKRDTFKHRERLRAQGRIDAATPRFSSASKFWTPWETLWARRHAVKYRLSSPIVAVEDWRLWKMSGKPKVWPLVSETAEEPSQEPLHIVSTTPSRETGPSPLVSRPRPALPSPETVTVSGEDAPFVSAVSDETETADRVKTVGRLRDEDGLSYAKIAIRLGISKAQAGRLGQEYDKRPRLRPEPGETTVPVAN
jgi:hypothetical protein